MREMCNEDYVVAIGECGLDYKRNYSSKEDQINCFKKHLELATDIDLPMFLHEKKHTMISLFYLKNMHT